VERRAATSKRATVTTEIVYDPYDYAIDADPHPVWKRMRDDAPVYWNEKYEFWALSRFADVYEASRDIETFSSARGTVLELIDQPIEAFAPMIFQDPPYHTLLRALVSRAFTPRRIIALEARIRELVVQYLDPVVGGAGFDYVQEFAAKLPAMVIGSLLGVPEADQDTVRRQTDEMLHIEPGETLANKQAVVDLYSYWFELVKERRTQPRDDLVTALLQSEITGDDGTPRRLDDMELLAFIGLLSGAGNETVARLMSWAVVLLARNRDQRALLVADPALLPNAIEELLRYEAPSPIQARWVTRPIEMHGVTIPAECKIALLTGSAGRDDREYPDADRFDVRRTMNRHASFGYGPHFCLGAALARLEARVALEETLARFPTWDIDESGLRWVHTSTVRGYETVPFIP
jgi:cytochrome P450